MINPELVNKLVNALYHSKPSPPPAAAGDATKPSTASAMAGAAAGAGAGAAATQDPGTTQSGIAGGIIKALTGAQAPDPNSTTPAGPSLLSFEPHPDSLFARHDDATMPPIDRLMQSKATMDGHEQALGGTPSDKPPTLDDYLEAHAHHTALADHVAAGGTHPFDFTMPAWHPSVAQAGTGDAATGENAPTSTEGKLDETAPAGTADPNSGTPQPVDMNSTDQKLVQLQNEMDHGGPTAPTAQDLKKKEMPWWGKLLLIAGGAIGNRTKGDPNLGNRAIQGIMGGFNAHEDQKVNDKLTQYQIADKEHQQRVGNLEKLYGYAANADAAKEAKRVQDRDFELRKTENETRDALAKENLGFRKQQEYDKLLELAGTATWAEANARIIALDNSDTPLSPAAKASIKAAYEAKAEDAVKKARRGANQGLINRLNSESLKPNIGGQARAQAIDRIMSLLDPSDPEDQKMMETLKMQRPDALAQTEAEKLLASKGIGQGLKNKLTKEQIALIADKVKYFDQNQQLHVAEIYQRMADTESALNVKYSDLHNKWDSKKFDEAKKVYDGLQASRRSVLGHLTSRINELHRERSFLLSSGKKLPDGLDQAISGLEDEASKVQTHIQQADDAPPTRPGLNDIPNRATSKAPAAANKWDVATATDQHRQFMDKYKLAHGSDPQWESKANALFKQYAADHGIVFNP